MGNGIPLQRGCPLLEEFFIRGSAVHITWHCSLTTTGVSVFSSKFPYQFSYLLRNHLKSSCEGALMQTWLLLWIIYCWYINTSNNYICMLLSIDDAIFDISIFDIQVFQVIAAKFGVRFDCRVKKRLLYFLSKLCFFNFLNFYDY